MAIINATDKKEFQANVLQNSKLVLVDFWAEWCPPCRMMSPVLERVAKTMESTVDIVKVNIEQHPDNAQIASEYGVQGIPNFLIFKDGEVVNQLVGMMPEAVLVDELEKHL